MRKFAVSVVILLSLLFVGACAKAPVSTLPAVPSVDVLQLDRYPLIPVKRPMLADEVQRLGLQPARLEKDTFVFNHYRGFCGGKEPCGKWEWLKAGTWVAVDKDGRPWYRLDCSNRLYVVSVGGAVGVGPPLAGDNGNDRGPSGLWPWGGLGLLGLLGLVGLLGLLGRRRQEEAPPRPPTGNGGNGHRPDPDLPGPAAFRPPQPAPAPAPPAVDQAAARRVALEREVAEQTAAAERHKAEAARLRGQFNPVGDPDVGIAVLGRVAAEDAAAKAAREAAAARQAELNTLGPPPAPVPTAPQPAPTSAPPSDDKAGLLATLRAKEKEAGIRRRALRVAIDSLEGELMTPDEVRGWLQKLGITL